MIPYVKIKAYGAQLEIHEFMLHLWPEELQPCAWPSFCGAGRGIGDWLVPEHICGVCVSPACFVHDLDWSTCDNNFSSFLAANWRFYQNLRALVHANADPAEYTKAQVERGCMMYFLAVMIFGWRHFKRDPDDLVVTDDPLDHPVVKSKLHRLALASLGIKQ